MVFKFLVLCGLLGLARCSVVPTAYAAAPVPVAARIEQYDPFPQYRFGYGVADALTGDYKSQQEQRDGDVVQGYYSLVDSDGTRRVVNYAADSVNGFNAVVRKEPLLAAQPALVEPAPAVVSARLTAPTAVLPARYAVARYAAAPAVVAPSAPLYAAASPYAARYAAYPYAARYAAAPVVAPARFATFTNAVPAAYSAPVPAAYTAAAPVPAAYAAAGVVAAAYTAPAAYASPVTYAGGYGAPARFVEPIAAGYRYP